MDVGLGSGGIEVEGEDSAGKQQLRLRLQKGNYTRFGVRGATDFWKGAEAVKNPVPACEEEDCFGVDHVHRR